MSAKVRVEREVARPRLIDLGFVLALTAMALFALDGSYDSRSYLLTGMIGATIPVLLAAFMGRSARSWGWYALLLVAVYTPAGAIAALGEAGGFGTPTPSHLLEVLTATLAAPLRILSTIPPVRAEGEVMVLPFLLGYVASAMGVATAANTTRPAAPALPLMLAMAVGVLMGAQRSADLLARTVVFAAVVLAWIAVRSGRSQRIDGAAHARWLRALIAIGLVSGVAFGVGQVVVPQAAEGDRVVLRGQVGRGEDVSQVDNPLSMIRRYRPGDPDRPPTLVSTPLLRINGLPSGVPLRMAVLDVYDGSRWVAENRTVAGTSDDLYQRIARQISPLHPGGPISGVKVRIEQGYRSDWLPLAGELTSLNFVGPLGDGRIDDVRYNPATASGILLGGVADGDDYEFAAVAPDTELTPTMKAFKAPEELQPRGRAVDDFVMRWASVRGGPVRRVLALADYLLENGRYSDGVGAESRFRSGHDLERITWDFISSDAPVGNDEQYAAFLALAANRLGVPARVVVGARPGPKGWVFGRDIHAWVELQVADGSWRTIPTERFMATTPPDHTLTGKPTPEQLEGLKNIKKGKTAKPSDAPEQSPQDPPKQDSERDLVREIWRALRTPGGLALALVLGVIVAVPLSKVLRYLRRRRTADPAGRVCGAWRHLTDTALDLGLECPPWLSRPEQAAVLGLDPVTAQTIDTLTFSGHDVTRAHAHEVWAAIRSQVRALRRRAGWAARLRSPWRLASWQAHQARRRAARVPSSVRPARPRSSDQARAEELQELAQR